MGDSLVKRGGQYAYSHKSDQLGQSQFRVVWLGQGGMRWNQLLPALQFRMITRGHPHVIILHLSGNDIDTISEFDIKKSIMEDLQYIHDVFHASHIVWCDVLPRLNWRNNHFEDSKTLNLKTVRINRAAHHYLAELSRTAVIKPHILWHMDELFDNDGVHLSDFGNMTYIQTFKNFMHSFISKISNN